MYLGRLADRPIWAPKILTISDFFGQIDPTPVPDNITLVFKLYESYCKISEKDISIDDFLPLGEMLLNDLNDIDNYMANPREVFANLAAIKNMEMDYSHLTENQIEAIRSFWNTFDPETLSPQQSGFLSVWDRLGELYDHFRDSLIEQNTAYGGMIARRLAEKARNERSLEIPFNRVVFAGFNALNKCERTIFHYLKIQQKASFFWDYPQLLLTEKQDPSNPAMKVMHEGGLFMKHNIYDFPSPENWEDPFNKEAADIVITAASNSLVQAGAVYDFLEQIVPGKHEEGKGPDADNSLKGAPASAKSNSLNAVQEEQWLKGKDSISGLKEPVRLQTNETGVTGSGKVSANKKDMTAMGLRTAVILADEQQLFPVLSSIPSKFSSINITLGYPLKSTPAFALSEILLAMQNNCRETREGKTWFYHRDVTALLQHQYILGILGQSALELTHKLVRYNSPFIEASLLKENNLCAKLFKKAGDVYELTSYLMDILTLIYRYLRGSDDQNVDSLPAPDGSGPRQAQLPVQGTLFGKTAGHETTSEKNNEDERSVKATKSSGEAELWGMDIETGIETGRGNLKQASDVEELDVHGEKKGLEMEFIYCLFTTVKRLSDILSKLPVQPNPTTWQSLFRKLAAFQSVPFNGEPLKGLQIMGLLETRALDFENLVIIGMNEGVFPKSSPPDSFIPYNLRKAFDLPVIDNQDAIFAYYFYRLIHRAKKVRLVYSTTGSGAEEAEMSRFLQQLYYEYPGKIIMETPKQKVSVPAIKELFAEKDEAVMAQLSRFLENGQGKLSPSAMSDYLECTLRFFYKHVARIREADSISEDLDPRIFGILFHRIMEQIYSPHKGKMIQKENIELWLNDKDKIREVMNSAFEESVPFIRQSGSEFVDLQGKNILVYEILFRYVVRFLEIEKDQAPFRLSDLEEKVGITHTVNKDLKVNIGGIIDRTDEKEGITRILDYKTGSASNSASKIEELFTHEKHGDKKAIFQTLLYSYIKSVMTGSDSIEPGIIPITKIFDRNFSSSITIDKQTIIFGNVKTEFLERLNPVLEELFNPGIPFVQTRVEKNCRYCLFRQHCFKD